MARKPLFTVETPVPEARFVTLYEDTWMHHIVSGHPEMDGQLLAVEQTLIVPTYVCEGNRGDSFQFITTSSPTISLIPLVVVVSGHSSTGELSVNTAYKGRNTHLDPTTKKIRWPK